MSFIRRVIHTTNVSFKINCYYDIFFQNGERRYAGMIIVLRNIMLRTTWTNIIN